MRRPHPLRARTALGPAVLGSAALAATGLVALAPSGIAATPATSGVVAATASGVDRGVTHEQNPLVPVGASWSEHYFSSPQADSPTPVELHADVLRPTTVPAGTRTPGHRVGRSRTSATPGRPAWRREQTGPSPASTTSSRARG